MVWFIIDLIGAAIFVAIVCPYDSDEDHHMRLLDAIWERKQRWQANFRRPHRG